MTGHHRRTFHLLGYEPAVSLAARRELEAVEARLGRRLPASMRDWYTRTGAVEILARHSSERHAVTLAELGQLNVSAAASSNGAVRMPILHENQGVCQWAIRFDGSDDPPVDVDGPFCRGETWLQYAPKFSDFVFAAVWDHVQVLHRAPLLQAQNIALSAQALAALNDAFAPLLVTHGWPAHTQYRFDGGNRRLLIWNDEMGQADWWLSADDDEAFALLLRLVWPLDDVGPSLWAIDAAGEAILKAHFESARLP